MAIQTRKSAGLDQLGPVHGNLPEDEAGQRKYKRIMGARVDPKSIRTRCKSSNAKRKVKITLPGITAFKDE